MMTTEQDVAQFIVSTVAANPNIRGAALGAKVKQRFPGVILGRLTEFINRHCANSVVAVDQKNLDYIWALKPDNNPPASIASIPSLPTSLLVSKAQEKPIELNSEPTNSSAWKIFTRSDTPGKIAVNPNTGQVKAVSTNEQVSQPFIEIPKVTPSEYQNIALEFANQMAEQDRQHFKCIAESAAFESEWYKNIMTWQSGRYLKSWGTFRFDMLCSIFTQRMVAKNVAEEQIRPCLEKLKRIKTKTSKEKETSLSVTPNSRRQPENNDISIRDIFAAAVKDLNEDDLRRVWLPVGVVLDAIRKR